MNCIYNIVAIVGTIVVLHGTASARHEEPWPWDRLYKESDLIVIAEAIESSDVEDKDKNRSSIEVNTRFRIGAVLKGTHDGTSFMLRHYRLSDSAPPVLNDPDFVAFEVKVKPGWPRKQYMLFLKKLDDGRFAAVSGNDTALSVRELVPVRG